MFYFSSQRLTNWIPSIPTTKLHENWPEIFKVFVWDFREKLKYETYIWTTFNDKVWQLSTKSYSIFHALMTEPNSFTVLHKECVNVGLPKLKTLLVWALWFQHQQLLNCFLWSYVVGGKTVYFPPEHHYFVISRS